MNVPNKLEYQTLQDNFQASVTFESKTSGLYYKPMMIVNDDSRVVTQLETSLTDDARVVICDCHMFIVQATELATFQVITSMVCSWPYPQKMTWLEKPFGDLQPNLFLQFKLRKKFFGQSHRFANSQKGHLSFFLIFFAIL